MEFIEVPNKTVNLLKSSKGKRLFAIKSELVIASDRTTTSTELGTKAVKQSK